MRKTERDNAASDHNATITSRPAILIPATGDDNDGLVIQMGTTGPSFVAANIRQDGAPLPGYVDWGLDPLESVREFTSAFMRVGAPEHAVMEANTTKKERASLHGLLRLRATRATLPVPLDTKAAQKALSDATKLLISDPRLQPTFQAGRLPDLAEWFYPAFFNRELKGARLVLWLTKQKQFAPAIFCPTMKAAMFAFAAFRGVAACPNCGDLFTLDTERPDKSRGERYCTAACGQRYRQKMYRKRSGASAIKSRSSGRHPGRKRH
jgi:hypothetical protein